MTHPWRKAFIRNAEQALKKKVEREAKGVAFLTRANVIKGEGLCYRCGEPAAAGRKQCQAHLDYGKMKAAERKKR